MTFEEIKKRYKKLALLYHPDKVVGEENKKKAQKKFLQLNQAYEAALEEKEKKNCDY